METAIDDRFLRPEGAGLGKYAENLLGHTQDKRIRCDFEIENLWIRR